MQAESQSGEVLGGFQPPLYELYSPFQYPWFCIVYFTSVWTLSVFLKRCLVHLKVGNIGVTFAELSLEKQKNVVTYAMQVVMTTMAVMFQFYGSKDILFNNEDTTDGKRIDCLTFALLTIAVLYIWEMIYREQMSSNLLLHHFVTLLLIQLSTASFHDSSAIHYIRVAALLGYNATLEQLSFVTLFCYRLNLLHAAHAKLFFWSCIQTFITKTIITLAAFGYYISFLVDETVKYQPTNWRWFWTAYFLVLLLALYGTQLYACKILFILYERCFEVTDSNPRNSLPESGQNHPCTKDLENSCCAVDKTEESSETNLVGASLQDVACSNHNLYNRESSSEVEKAASGKKYRKTPRRSTQGWSGAEMAGSRFTKEPGKIDN